MSRNEKYRHEWKYLIDTAQKELICQRLSHFLTLDKHAADGGYMIRSLYFDDYFNTAYAEKDAGVLERKKYRIRIYNCSDNSIKLERKKKLGSYIYKEAAPLTRDEVYKILDGDYDFLLQSQYSLCREFYFECISNVMRPRTVVDYEREPWILDEGTVRVTFDMDALTKVSGTPSKFIDFIYIRGGWTTANGFIDNVQWTEGCEHNYETVAKEPTFTEVGGNVHTCTKCGNSYITDVIPAHIFQGKTCCLKIHSCIPLSKFSMK